MSAKSISGDKFSFDVLNLIEKSKQSLVRNSECDNEENLAVSRNCERLFFAACDFLYGQDLNRTIALDDKIRCQHLKVNSFNGMCSIFLETMFWQEHLNYMDMFLKLLHANNTLKRLGCSIFMSEDNVATIPFSEYYISTEKALLLYLQIIPSDSDVKERAMHGLLLSPETKKLVQEASKDDDQVLKSLAAIFFQLDSLQRYYDLIAGKKFYEFEDHFSKTITELYNRFGDGSINRKSLRFSAPGMLKQLQFWMQSLPKIREEAHVKKNFVTTLEMIFHVFSESISEFYKFIPSNYWENQIRLLIRLKAELSRNKSIVLREKTSCEISVDDIIRNIKFCSSCSKHLYTSYNELTSATPLPSSTVSAKTQPISSQKKGKKEPITPKLSRQKKAPVEMKSAGVSKPVSIISTSSEPSSSSEPQLEAPFISESMTIPHPFIKKVIDAKKITYADRVQRWMKINETTLEMIRNFQDQGRLDYIDLSQDELKNQWDYHSFSVLVDRVLGDRFLRSMFSIKTSKGRALFAELQRLPDGVRQRGVVTYGFGGNPKRCYHRHFKPVTNQQVLQGKLYEISDALTSDFRLHEPELEASSRSLADDIGEGFIGDEFDFDPKSSIYRVTDKVHNMRICILPLHPQIL